MIIISNSVFYDSSFWRLSELTHSRQSELDFRESSNFQRHFNNLSVFLAKRLRSCFADKLVNCLRVWARALQLPGSSFRRPFFHFLCFFIFLLQFGGLRSEKLLAGATAKARPAIGSFEWRPLGPKSSNIHPLFANPTREKNYSTRKKLIGHFFDLKVK